MDSIFAKGQARGIIPDHLEILFQNYKSFKESKAFTPEAFKFKSKRQQRDDFLLRDEVAIIQITGPIYKRKTLFSFLFGGSPIDELTETFNDAMTDPDVKAIVFDIDSPGGTLGGLEAFSELVYSARGKKPIISFANGMMASAAYWIGSTADMVIAESTADIGSIGVLMIHYDYSTADERYGLKRTFLTAGKYKALGNNAEPLSQEARDVFQAELDYLYSIFVNTVARNRGVSPQTVLEKMADGRIFISQQAVGAGLVDKIGTIEDAIESAAIAAEQPQKVGQASALVGADERTRILNLAKILFGNKQGKKFEKVIRSEVTVEQFKAIKTIGLEQDNRTESKELKEMNRFLANLKRAEFSDPDDFMDLVAKYQQLHKCGKVKAMQAVMKSNPNAHKAYIRKVNQ